MSARSLILVAAVAAVTTTAVAAAGPIAAEQRVQFDLKPFPEKRFALTPLEPGSVKADSGKLAKCAGEYAFPSDVVMRNGQEGWPKGCRAATLTGAHGSLVLRTSYTWVEAGGPYNIATGTWKVLRGTGQYAGITGSGRIAQVGAPNAVRARYQGFLRVP